MISSFSKQFLTKNRYFFSSNYWNLFPKMAGFFGTRIPNPREGKKILFPRASPLEKNFFLPSLGFGIIVPEKPPFWESLIQSNIFK